jgi:DNA replication protein DnaC
METTNCIICDKPFEFEPIIGIPFELKPTVCEACDQRQKQGSAAAKERVNFAYFGTICPPLYQDTDPNHPSMPTATKLAKILNWEFGQKGLVLHGVTRRCKTRSMWLLIKRLIMDHKIVEAVTSSEFSMQSVEAHTGGANALAAWFERLTRADVLFLDDIDKITFTDRVEQDIYDILDTRAINKRPVLITTNFVGDTLAKKFKFHGEPIVARIREFCEAIHL